MDIDTEILSILLKQLQQRATPGEQARLEQWLNANPQNHREYQKVVDVWQASENLNTRIDVDKEWNTFKAKHFAPPKKGKLIQVDFKMVGRIAAAAILIIGIFMLGRHFLGPHTYSTQAGERLMVHLPDGTQVILGQNSEMDVPRAFNKAHRQVQLRGEGFFEVAQNREKPFEITGPTTGTRVLGTEFWLMAKSDTNALQVSGGKVAYWQNGRADTLRLTTGQEGRLSKNQLSESTIEDPNYNSWYTGTFTFENQPIATVVDALQNHYVFTVKNLEALQSSHCRFSGSFENQELSDILDELALVLKLDYQWEASTLTVKAIHCQ